MAHPVTWFQIDGQDGGALQRFYAEVFNWKMGPSPDGSGMAMVSPNKGGIAGGIGHGMPARVTVYVGCDDVDAMLAKVEGAGGQRALDKRELPDGMGHIAGFIDPAGNFVGLWAAGKAARPAPQRKASKKKEDKDKGKDKKKGDKKPEKSKKAEKKAKKAEKAGKAGKKAGKKG
jgi:predicted enzyme related to lactoylglutathione lyase